METVEDMLKLIKDTVMVSKRGKVVESQIPEDMDSLGIYVMLTEEARRHRVCRIDLGDDSAKLKIVAPGGGGGGVKVAPPAQGKPASPVVMMTPQVQQNLIA